MSNQPDRVGGGDNFVERKMTLEALLEQSENLRGFSPARRLPMRNEFLTANPFFALQNSELACFQHTAAESFGARRLQHQQFPIASPFHQTKESLLLLRQLHLQKQQQLLLQANALAGALEPNLNRFGIGMGAFDVLNYSSGLLGTLGENVGNAGPPSNPLNLRTTLPQNVANTDVKLSLNSLQSSGASIERASPYLELNTRQSQSFPVTLHRILADLEASGSSHIASFVAEGDAFVINNTRQFETLVIPKYFPRMGSFGSFQRQLNLYDFKRITRGPHRGAYTHPLFRQNHPEYARDMKRTKIKGVRSMKSKSLGEGDEEQY